MAFDYEKPASVENQKEFLRENVLALQQALALEQAHAEAARGINEKVSVYWGNKAADTKFMLDSMQAQLDELTPAE